MGCVHAVLDERKRHAYIVDVEAQPEETLFAHHDEYEIGSLIQTGGVGRVYRGVRKVDKRPVALKMFGYTPRIPTEAEVNKEIRHMMALGEVPGIIQCLGLFRDTAVGLVPGKLCTTQFPVIAMELVEGGDFLSRVLENRMVSEKVLSQLFKALVKTLSLIHEKGFVHRDVKLENLLFCKYETFSTIKVIDLGMMVQLSPKSSVHISDGIQGTPGYLAPESILCHEYSAATDMWQAGCCLYTMLSAEPAFIEDNLQQVTEGEFNKMKGFSWVGISEDAKDLVTSLLTKDKTLRISAEDVLKHPWIVSTSTGVNLEKEYYARIKALSLRRNLRGIYKVQNILQANKRRRTEFSERLRSQSIALKRETSSRRGSFSSQESQKVKLPRARSNSISSSPGSAQKSREMSTSSIPGLSIFTKPSFMSGDSDANLESLFVDIIFQHKLDTLRKYIVREACPKFLEDGGLFAANGSWLSRNADTALNFEKFVELVKAVDLTELAHMSIFNSFDLNPEGTLNLGDALLGLLAMKTLPKFPSPVPTPKAPTPKNMKSMKITQLPIDSSVIAAAQIYFCLYDIEGIEQIRLKDVKFIFSLLLNDVLVEMDSDELAATERHIEEIFLMINISKTGALSFDEFAKFFNSIMMTTSQLRYSRASTQETARKKVVISD